MIIVVVKMVKGKNTQHTIALIAYGVRTMLCQVFLWNHVVIGAGSVVTKDIPDNCMTVGNPAKIIRKEHITI